MEIEKIEGTPNRSAEVILGSLIGLGIIAIIQLIGQAAWSRSLTISLYCFAISIPLLTVEVLNQYAEEKYGYSGEYWFRSTATATGLVASVVGISALIFYRSIVAGLLFSGLSAMGLVVVCYYGVKLAQGRYDSAKDY